MNSEINKKRNWLLNSLARYWPVNQAFIAGLSVIPTQKLSEERLPPVLEMVELPLWAADVGVEGQLLVPKHYIHDGVEETWKRLDWFGAALWYLDGTAERAHEKVNGPIHSYSYRLRGWDQRVWERAWVNRIALFLRRWAAYQHNGSEVDLFGPLPTTNIIITHDLDAVSKTFAIRMKQSAFHSFNTTKLILKGQHKAAVTKFLHALRFFFIQEISIALMTCADWKRLKVCAA